MRQSHDRMCALANSLPAAIRWRFRDYEQLLKKELQILAAAPLPLARTPREHSGLPAPFTARVRR